MVKKSIQNTYDYAVGRRKTAVATVKLYKGKGNSEVNGIAVEKYFPTENAKIVYEKPFVVTKTMDKFYFHSKLSGGGKEGQVEALSLAVSRALKKIDETGFGPTLRQAGLLTVDARVRERRMVGTGGKSRRQKQSPKR